MGVLMFFLGFLYLNCNESNMEVYLLVCIYDLFFFLGYFKFRI